jgi:hypothetical protein
MKKIGYLFLLAGLCFPLRQAYGQEKSQEKLVEKPKAAERAKILIPVKVQIVFTEQEGEKKISSVPYSFTAIASELGPYEGTSIRHGVRIPIETETDGKEHKITYLDIGTNIDCRILVEEDGRFHFSLTLDRSALYPSNAASDEKQDISRANGQPFVRTFRTNENMILKDGQTTETVLSTDPLSGHTLRVTVTINVQK